METASPSRPSGFARLLRFTASHFQLPVSLDRPMSASLTEQAREVHWP